jgi:hypothetical protein
MLGDAFVGNVWIHLKSQSVKHLISLLMKFFVSAKVLMLILDMPCSNHVWNESLGFQIFTSLHVEELSVTSILS